MTFSYLENCIHRFSGVVPIGGGPIQPAGESWFLSDPTVRVIALDSCTNDAQLTWALWTLCHLRYPLTWLLDACPVIRDGLLHNPPRNWYLFQGTGSLVDIYNHATKLIFVLPANNMYQISFGEVEYNVAAAARLGQVVEGAPEFDADPLISWMLNRVCGARAYSRTTSEIRSAAA